MLWYWGLYKYLRQIASDIGHCWKEAIGLDGFSMAIAVVYFHLISKLDRKGTEDSIMQTLVFIHFIMITSLRENSMFHARPNVLKAD